MQSSEHSELALFLSEALSYWRADLSRFSLTVWQQACEPFSLEQVRKAFTAHATDPQRGTILRFELDAADAIIALDDTFRVVRFNRGAEQIFGWTEAEMLGQPIDRLLPMAARAVGISYEDLVLRILALATLAGWLLARYAGGTPWRGGAVMAVVASDASAGTVGAESAAE